MSPQLISTLVTVALVGLVLTFRMRSMSQGRRLRLETLWIRPAMLVAVAGFMIYRAPPGSLIQIAVLVAATAVGAAIGWRQAKLMAIGIEPDSHQLNIKASPAAIIVIVAIVALRVMLRPLLIQEASALHVSVVLVLDGLVLLVVGLYVAQAIEMYLRASAMLREAKAGGVKDA